jgi:hypothetical protein
MDHIARFISRRSAKVLLKHDPEHDPQQKPQPVEPPPPHSCGWFESTHELKAGLSIVEHLSPDSVANELPLAAWLRLHSAQSRACA